MTYNDPGFSSGRGAAHAADDKYDGHSCPKCHSQDVEWGQHEVDAAEVSVQRNVCLGDVDCGIAWVDTYRLVSCHIQNEDGSEEAVELAANIRYKGDA